MKRRAGTVLFGIVLAVVALLEYAHSDAGEAGVSDPVIHPTPTSWVGKK